MKKLITIFAVLGLMLSTTCVSWAVPMVTSPPGAPSWWNSECPYYAYGWWEKGDIAWEGEGFVPDNPAHWASNFLVHDQFYAAFDNKENTSTIYVNLVNEYRPDYMKELYICIEGTTDDTVNPPTLDTLTIYSEPGDESIFTGSQGGINNGDGTWKYVVSGVIIPQPWEVDLQFDVPGLMTSVTVTNIWAGENCIPEPATMCLLGLGALGLLRKRRA